MNKPAITMHNPPMPKQSKKALYLFLCSVLGVIMFTFMHQAFWVIYVALARLGYLPQIDPINPLPALSLVAAFLVGMWYGIWLGLYWYEIVYERAQAKWFYAFGGNRGRSSRGQAEDQEPLERLPWQSQGAFRQQANANRWQLEDLMDDRELNPSELDSKQLSVEPEPEPKSTSVFGPVRVSVATQEVPARKRLRKSPAKTSRPRRTPSV